MQKLPARLLHSFFTFHISRFTFSLPLQTEAQHTSWIEGCRRGDRKAQEALYRAYYRSMMTLCLRYTRNEQDALEALNSGFLKVFQQVGKYNASLGSMYTWMRTLVLRSCIDHVKGKQQVPAGELLSDAEMVTVAPDAWSRMSAAELLRLVRSLPPATGAVFNLYVVDGYPHKEIAALLGISEGTSKWHLSEARKQLQQMIELQEVMHD
jgi:RNA polymerase sigma factor (sigma-70 family)